MTTLLIKRKKEGGLIWYGIQFFLSNLHCIKFLSLDCPFSFPKTMINHVLWWDGISDQCEMIISLYSDLYFYNKIKIKLFHAIHSITDVNLGESKGDHFIFFIPKSQMILKFLWTRKILSCSHIPHSIQRRSRNLYRTQRLSTDWLV